MHNILHAAHIHTHLCVTDTQETGKTVHRVLATTIRSLMEKVDVYRMQQIRVPPGMGTFFTRSDVEWTSCIPFFFVRIFFVFCLFWFMAFINFVEEEVGRGGGGGDGFSFATLVFYFTPRRCERTDKRLSDAVDYCCFVYVLGGWPSFAKRVWGAGGG